MAYYFTNKIKEEIGKRIARERKKKGLKQAVVAEEAGINSSYFGKIERGIQVQSARSDRLYEMFIDLLKEKRGEK